MGELCRAIGELVLWTSIIDGQLSTAASLMFVKDDTPTVELLVGEIEFRRKAELLKTRAKEITGADDWMNAICKWVKKAEAINDAPNIVAHQRPTGAADTLALQSHQLTRIIKSIKKEPVNLPRVLHWIEDAKRCHEQGGTVIGNLREFASAWRAHAASVGAN